MVVVCGDGGGDDNGEDFTILNKNEIKLYFALNFYLFLLTFFANEHHLPGMLC